MRKITIAVLQLLFIFMSCTTPSSGTLNCYKVLFDDSDANLGVVDVNISGSLDSYHAYPALYISIRSNSECISTDLYSLNLSSENLTCYPNSEKKEYCICLEPGEINYNIRIQMQEPGNYKVRCWIQADRIASNLFDGHVGYFDFTYE